DLPVTENAHVYNVKDFGAKCDGITEDHTAIQAAIDAAATTGGTVQFPAGTTLIGATLTLRARVTLKGISRDATVIKAKNALNADMIRSANYAALTGQNKSAIADGVPYGFGLESLRLDGNAANQTAGNGFVVYGKRYSLRDVCITNVKGIGWMSEGYFTNAVSATYPEEPESLYTNVDVQNCGSHGIQYRGPSDAVWLAVFSHQNAGWGVRFESDGATYQCASDARLLHIYANTAGGVFVSANTRMRFGHVATESNYGQGLLDQSFATTYDCIESYINCRTTGTHQIELSGSAINVTKIYNTDGATNKSGVLSTGGSNRIAAGVLLGAGSSGTGLTIAGPQCDMRLSVLGYSGTGGLGVQFGSGGVALSGSTFDLLIYDCKTAYTNVVAGPRNAGRVAAQALAGQTLVGTDFSSVENIDVQTIDTTVGAVAQRLAPSGALTAPGLSFTVDRDTGLFRPGADIAALGAGGLEVARFISSGLHGFVSVGSPNLFGSPGGQFPLVQINRNSAVAGIFMGNWSSTSASAPQTVLAKSKSGTVNTFGAVANNDVVGEHWFVADDGDQFIPAALIRAEVDGTPGNNDMPGRLIFATTADGAQAATERLRISQAGVVELASGELRIGGDQGGAAGKTTLTNTSDLTTNSTGVGAIKFKGASNRDSAGFIKAYIGNTAYYIPLFATIAG
ncbi:MAG: glycosyl hydrolase family 28-related protein, partial [Micropepsaceae bacterium]